MKKLIVSLVALLAVVVVGQDTGKSAPVVRVGTYNIRNSGGDRGTENAWELRRVDLAALLRKFDLDAFGLQEVLPDQADFLRKQFPEYEMVGVHRDDGKRKGEASPVFYRKARFECLKNGTFWLSETPDVPGSKSWNTACTRVCSWAWLKDRRTGKTFCFANTHTDHRSEQARREGMLLIARKMKDFSGGAPVVFTGDHNCQEYSQAAQAISKILRNAIHHCETPVEGPWLSSNGWRYYENPIPAAKVLKIPQEKMKELRMAGNREYGRIDYIYVSPGIKVKKYATHDDTRPGTKLYPSDHFPVTAVIQFK